MPKRLIKKYFPSPEKIKSMKSLGFLGAMLQEPNLWHINRRSVSKAFLVGIFCCFLPIPLQMALAALIAIWINCNLPITIMLVWLSNPVTMPPMFYFNYLIGTYILRTPHRDFEVELTFAWFSEKIVEIGLPLYVGSLVCGLFFSAIAYLIIDIWWRRKILRKWKKRRSRRLKTASVTTVKSTN